jgi:ATP-dependent RNA helicase DeaD
MLSFEELGLSEETLKVLKKKGFEVPSPIQEVTIPAILNGNKDIVAQAQTGTGKTAAFGLPLVERLDEHSRSVQALVLTPTRELAIQVGEEIHSLKGKKNLTITPIYGGQSITLQLRSLKKGVDIVIGTPGRVLDHIARGTLKLGEISYLVLDEADEMLNMGFLEDVKKIMGHTPANKRTMLFSATMPKEIIQIAREHMMEFDEFKVSKDQLTVSQTDQIYFEVSASNKFEALCRIIDIEEDFFGLVFCRTKKDVDTIANHLVERGYDADALHGDLSQPQREKILNKFKKHLINILVATDVAARGIDVQDLTHVINFALPQDAESYVHRIGRTGRAGKEGNAITFITPEEYRKLRYISRETKTDIRKAKLPDVKDVIKTKKIRIRNILKDIVEASPRSEYMEMSRELLDANSPEDVVAALLEYSFQDELDEKNYREIGNALVDTKGKTRLFVTQGKKDGLTSQKLMHFIQNKCGVKSKNIRDVQILEKFSFVTLPFHDAELVLSSFKGKQKGKGPFITKANKARENG